MNNLDYETDKSAQTLAADTTVALPHKTGKITIKMPNKKAPAVVYALAAKAVDAPVDPLEERVHEIENLDKETAIKRVFECEDKVAETYFELGGALTRIRDCAWFDPYPTFDKWVEGKTAMRRSKARALMQIYGGLANSDLPWSKVSHLGWTQLRTIARVLTKENASDWIEIASKHSRSELIEIVRKHVADHSAEHPEIATPTHRKTFAFYEDQNANVEAALEKAMKDANTDVLSEALSLICIDYLGGCSLAERLKAYKPETVLTAFNKAFPHFAQQVVVSDDDGDHGDGS